MIYVMTHEYLKLIQEPRERKMNLSVGSFAVHSVWNFLSIVIHLVIGTQLFTQHQRILWLPIGALIICHFSI